ncbi:cytoplasmic tRNA 2-thiolation protein 2 isoform X2 [Pempheris klunzingeri]|uniref:cytoplasmic tRNA 2-thiolation protein 2 isoform X2 n=1 Tax=Pempheris klunzingeri TaxID=3127111 RepID=UPI00397EC2E3
MCQVDEDYRDLLEGAEVPSVSKKCVKCKEAPAAVVIRAGDAYCRGCFKEYFIHKFRAMLGKNRIIFPGEKVLLAVSGGPSSCSMLSQVLEGLSQNAHKKLRFLPGIVHIDEGGAVGQSEEGRRRTLAELQSVFKATGYPFHFVPLEQVLDLPTSVVVTEPPPSARPASAYKAAVGHFNQNDSSGTSLPAVQEQEDTSPPAVQEQEDTSPPAVQEQEDTSPPAVQEQEDTSPPAVQEQEDTSPPAVQEQEDTSPPAVQASHTQSLQQLMGSAKTLTAREDLLNTLRQHLLVHTARTEGYSKVMLGDSCTRLAVKLLTSISLGRGAQLAQDTGFSDSRYGDVTLVRPMRDYSAKEIAFYNRMFSVPSVFIAGLDSKTTDKASIQRLTESFVTKLQADFPSTVSTIYRTSEKLQTACQSSSSADHCDRCLLCMCVLDTAVENASAFTATLISEQLSQTKSPGATRPRQPPVEADSTAPTGQSCSSGGGEHCGKAASGGGCCSSARGAGAGAAGLRSLLCYSCQLTIKDMSSLEGLPQYILSEAQRRQRRSKMREDISEFLLDHSDDGD